MMKTHTKSKILEQHGKPITRRQFVSLGLTAAGGFAFAPTLFHALKIAKAQASGVLPLTDSVSTIPFITFDLAGGAGLPGNFLVGGKGGPEDLLSSYDLLGWNPRSNGYDSRFGLPMAKADISQIFNGMTQVMSPEAQAQFRMGSIMNVSRDDTSGNNLSIAQLVSAAGRVGIDIGSGVGMTQTASGGNSISTKEFSEYSVRYISKLDDLLNANAVSQPLQSLGNDAIRKIFDKIHSLSMTQMSTLLSQPATPETLATLDRRLAGATEKSVNIVALDPRTNKTFAQIYQLTPNSSATDMAVIRSGLVMGALTGRTGPAVITIGGCDYHTGSSKDGDSKDLEIGIEIGRAIEAAHQLKTPLFIHILTDGGVSAVSGTRNWNSDSGEKSMTVMGVYLPNQTPSYLDKNRVQLGAYTSGQGSDRDFFFAASPALTGYSVFANYLSVCNRLGDFDDLTGRAIAKDDLKSVLIFGA